MRIHRPARGRSRLALLLAPVALARGARSWAASAPAAPAGAGVRPASADHGPVAPHGRQLVSYYRSQVSPTNTYRAKDATLEQLARHVRDRGQSLQRARRHRVRAVDRRDGLVQLPRRPDRAPDNNNFPGSGHATSCGNGYQFSNAQAGVRAQIQLLRNYADTLVGLDHHPRRAGSRAVGQASRRPRTTTSTTTSPRAGPGVERHGQRQLGDRARLRDDRPAGLQRDPHRQRRLRLPTWVLRTWVLRASTVRSSCRWGTTSTWAPTCPGPADAVDGRSGLRGRRRSAAPRRAPSCGTRPRPRRARSSRCTKRSRSRRPCRYRSISIGKSRDGRQSPYHDGLSAPPRPKNSIIGRSIVIVGVGHADLHDRAGEVARVERLLQHLGAADGLDAHVGAVAVGERADRLDRIGLASS